MKEIKVVQIPKLETIIEPIIETSNIKVVSIPKLELTTDIEVPLTSSIRVTTEGPSVEEIINRFLSGEISEEEYDKLLSEVIIRFNTEPRKYEKADYRKLIQAIIGLRRILEKRIKDCEDRITECENRLDDHDDTLQDHEDRIISLEHRTDSAEERLNSAEGRLDTAETNIENLLSKVDTLETIDIKSSNLESLSISKDGVNFTLNPILLEEITEAEQVTDKKKTASVSSIRNYITNQLTWIEK